MVLTCRPVRRRRAPRLRSLLVLRNVGHARRDRLGRSSGRATPERERGRADRLATPQRVQGQLRARAGRLRRPQGASARAARADDGFAERTGSSARSSHRPPLHAEERGPSRQRRFKCADGDGQVKRTGDSQKPDRRKRTMKERNLFSAIKMVSAGALVVCAAASVFSQTASTTYRGARQDPFTKYKPRLVHKVEKRLMPVPVPPIQARIDNYKAQKLAAMNLQQSA